MLTTFEILGPQVEPEEIKEPELKEFKKGLQNRVSPWVDEKLCTLFGISVTELL